jgi:predicted lipid carrier protein YhbT
MTATSSFELPQPVGALLSNLPAYPGSLLLVGALNLVLAKQLPDDVRRLLLDKKLRIHVRDARLTFDFAWTGQRFAACARQQATDLTLSATAHDFLRLAQRQEDPDTLFFSRRLSIEGDTELGLVVKNALDALELPVLDLRQWAPHQVLARFALWRRERTASQASGARS